METFKNFNESRSKSTTIDRKDHDFVDFTEWSKIKKYLDVIDYDNKKMEISQMYDWDEEEYDSEYEWYESHTHFTQDVLMSEIIGEIEQDLKVTNIEGRYSARIEHYIEQYL